MTILKKTSPIHLWQLCVAIIGVESQWCRGAVARDKFNVPRPVDHKYAVCWCSAGIIRKLCQGRDPKAVAQAEFVLRAALDVAATEQLPPKTHIRVRPFITLNDVGDHEKVMKMWRRAQQVISDRPDGGRK